MFYKPRQGPSVKSVAGILFMKERKGKQRQRIKQKEEKRGW